MVDDVSYADALPSSLGMVYEELVSRNIGRDKRHRDVTSARRGDVHDVMPGIFPNR